MKAGLGRDAVRNVLRGRSSGASMKTLAALAPVLGVSVLWLAGGQDETLATQSILGTGTTLGGPGLTLQVRREVGAGYWVAFKQNSAVTLGGGMVVPDPEFPTELQWMERVIGDGAAPDYPAGSLIHVVDITLVGAPRRGDHVVVERSRPGGRETERSIREVASTPVGLAFKPLSLADPSAAPLVAGHADGIDTRVAALILGSYRPRN